MLQLREEPRVGLDYLSEITTLLQRVRGAHPTAGYYEAADLQWWWVDAVPSDDVPQLFWFDDLGRPEAAVIATDWGERISLDPIVLPDASPDVLADVFERGLAHAAATGFDAIGLEVDSADEALRDVVVRNGFAIGEDLHVEAWLAADARPGASPLHDGYRLCSRLDAASRPHHMNGPKRHHADVGGRLRETSLYRPDLDLVVYDGDGNVAAYGLFWYDPVTATGLVEPMRTADAHQQRGLARHVLTAGLDALAAAGAERIKICYEPDNPASGSLYRSVGFEPHRQTVLYTGNA